MHRSCRYGLLSCWVLLATAMQLLLASSALAKPDAATDVAKQVQSLFKASCHSCHGPEEQESGLRLDLKRRAFEGGDGGQIIVPGNTSRSRLLRIVSGLDDDVGMMPPEGEGTPLSKEQIHLLRTWIEQGAKWPEQLDGIQAGTGHWSFQPIERPAVPAVKDPSWLANSIDGFVLANLESRGIAPAPPADRSVLIKRLYLDLLGLLPAPNEVNSFVNDSRPQAYERLVERVFASPHFGERWGRHWLDLARYADSDGYEKDRPRPHAWRFRNWVIEVINADLPFDQFTVQQIAGDMLAEATTDHRVASGFHRNTLHNTEGGTDPEEDRVKKTVDRTNTLGSIWLGLTVGCCQCHTHKYDPLTQREYYSLYSFFNNIDETDIDAPLAVDRQRYQLAKHAFDAEHAKLQRAVERYEQTSFAASLTMWEQTALRSVNVWRTLDPTEAISKHGATLKRQPDLSLLATGTNQVSVTYTVEAAVQPGPLTAIRLEVLPDKSLPEQGPGRAANGNFVLTTLRLLADLDKDSSQQVAVKLDQPLADFSQQDWPVAAAINDQQKDGWAVGSQTGKRHVAVFAFKQPVVIGEAGKLTIKLEQNYSRDSHNLGRFRLSVTGGTMPLTLEGMSPEVAQALAIERHLRTADQQQQISSFFRTVDPELLRLQKIVDTHAQQAPQPSDVKAQSVVQTKKHRETRLHIRGDFLNKGQTVPTATPQVLHAMKPRGDQPDRLDLANWVVARANPLTARVTVNRMWQRFFGRGLVNTIDDFGSQGDPPSHPHLLDWLASELRDSSWSIKRIQRVIVLSSTYRQSAAIDPALADIDPENILLARQTRRRVESEVIRDLALNVSGLLDERVGGPSVRPRQPAEYSALTYANSARWKVSPGGDAYRRGLYTFFQRTSPYPMLMTFDSPDGIQCCAQRTLSNTPLQALTLWNDPVFFECARAFSRRVVREMVKTQGSDPARDRAVYAFQLGLAREPSENELAELLALYDAQLEFAHAAPQAAAAIVGPHSPAERDSVSELAAWTIVGRTIMNLDEFITRE